MADDRHLKVLWLSPSYGYGEDLMYFEGIFKGYTRHFPRTRIAVDHQFPCENYSHLPLWPILRFKPFKLRRFRDGVFYPAEIKLPSPAFLKEVAHFDPDVVIAVEFTPVAILGLIFAKLRRKKLLLLIESDPLFRGGLDNVISRTIKSFIAKCADLALTNNASGNSYLSGRLGVPLSRILTQPYLTSEPNIHRGEGAPPSDALAPRVCAGKINALFINSVEDRKGLLELVAAVRQLDEACRQAYVFHIAGSGSKLDGIKSLVAGAGLSSSFEFYGHIPYKSSWRFYEAADLVISPTLADYRSLIGFEAVNCGVPLLLSRLDGAHHEVVEEGMNGWTFDPRDADEFVQRLAWFAAHRERLREFAKASGRLGEKFSVARIVQNLESATLRVARG